MNTVFSIYIIILMLIIIYVIYNNLQNEYYVDPSNGYQYTPDEIYTHLCFIDDILTKHQIKHWIMFGTLLGAVRQHDIIPYDYDFDFGANIQDVDKIMSLNNEINKYGYKFYLPVDTIGYNYNDDNDTKTIWRISFKIEYNGIVMGDIYLFDKFDDGIMRRFDKKTGTYMTPNISYPSWFTDKLAPVIIRDRYFPAPRYPQILLEQWYGSTWKIPIKSKAQGGNGDENSDYYGTSKHISMKKLLDFVAGHVGGKYEKPTLDKKINYFCPYDQKQWIVDNDS